MAINTDGNLDLAMYAMIQDIDGDCENPARNCYTCKHNTKCKVMHVKEALCMIDGMSKVMSNERFVQLRNWAGEYYRQRGGF